MSTKNSGLTFKTKARLISTIYATFYGYIFVGNYISMDDYNFIKNRETVELLLVGAGRPVSSLLTNVFFRWINDLNFMVMMHIMVIPLIILLFCILLELLLKFLKPHIALFLLIFGSTLCLGLIVQFAWIQYWACIWGSILSLLGAKFFIDDKSWMSVGVLLGLPFVIYQPSAALGLIAVLFFYFLGFEFKYSKQEQVKLLAFVSIFPLISIASVLFGKTKGWAWGERTQFFGNLPEKVDWILFAALPRALSFGDPFFRQSSWITFAAIIYLTSIKSLGKLWKFPLFVTISYGLVLVPSLITSENWASDRSLFAGQLLSALMVGYSLSTLLDKVFRVQSLRAGILLMLSAAAFLVFANTVNSYWIRPQVSELEIAKAYLNSEICSKSRYVVPSHWTQAYNGKISMDEFGRPTSSQEWSVAAYANLICKSYYGIDKDYELSDYLAINESELVIDFRNIMSDLPEYDN